jgi:NAD(P)-dependent dehydrogenase (short-subunit alcohol dehydrogenase family)
MTPRATRQVKKLAGKVVLVTGGAVRVGRSIALALAREGADVAIGYRGSAAAAHATVADLRALGVRAVALRADLGRPAAARALVARAAGPAAGPRGGGGGARAPRAGWAASTSSSTTPPSSSARRSRRPRRPSGTACST